MSDRCPKCDRMRIAGMSDYREDRCSLPGGATCRVVAAAYTKGLRAGVELAKRTIDTSATWVSQGCYRIDFDWTDCDAALAALERGE